MIHSTVYYKSAVLGLLPDATQVIQSLLEMSLRKGYADFLQGGRRGRKIEIVTRYGI